MISIMKTLFTGANARAEDRLKDTFALELIDQKIRETETQLKAAKATLASLVQRQRSEQRQFDGLQTRIATMMERTREALDAERQDLASEAANAIATMENEATLRQQTLDRLEQQTLRLRTSVETSHRRIIDLKQGAISAKAIKREQCIQSGLRTTISRTSSADEAAELIAQVVGKDDPFEQSDILSEIDASLDHSSLEDRMASAGFGEASKTTGADILARLAQK
ncbi:PspA/IM30 family protein [Planktotalea sp.]|uniref:PspA/IM30 family protein n=1 Tax=Planktotalea sp. TaxID=2029877 RepID=UPI003D6A9259